MMPDTKTVAEDDDRAAVVELLDEQMTTGEIAYALECLSFRRRGEISIPFTS